MLYTIANKIRKMYWKIAQPVTVGARVVLLNKEKQILLIKHSYLPHWYLPGGGVSGGETLFSAVRRELSEEVSIANIDDLKLASVHSNFGEGKSDHIAIFTASTTASVGSLSGEVSEARFFNLTQLPENISPATKRRLDEIFHGAIVSESW